MTENEKSGQASVKRLHTLMLDNNAKLTVSGVAGVKNYNEKEVSLILNEYILLIGGEELSLDKLSVDDGNVSIIGRILTLRYLKTADRTGFLKRLTK